MSFSEPFQQLQKLAKHIRHHFIQCKEVQGSEGGTYFPSYIASHNASSLSIVFCSAFGSCVLCGGGLLKSGRGSCRSCGICGSNLSIIFLESLSAIFAAKGGGDGVVRILDVEVKTRWWFEVGRSRQAVARPDTIEPDDICRHCQLDGLLSFIRNQC